MPDSFLAKTGKTGCGRIYKITKSKPFSQGCNRYAFEAVITEGPCKGEKGVVKIYKDKGLRGKTDSILKDIKISEIAKKHAQEFSKILKNDHLLKIRSSEMTKIQKTYKNSQYFKVGDYVAVERFIPYSWKRWTTCWGHENIKSQVLRAYEHFVYEKSEGKRMICDMQGGEHHGKFILTDPTLSSTRDRDKDLPLNGKQKTIKTVMARHHCNTYCEKLHLKKN